MSTEPDTQDKIRAVLETMHPKSPMCEHCPLNREMNLMIGHHERRISALEVDMKTVRDFVIESKFLRQLTLGGGILSVIALALQIFTLFNNGNP